ncbi:MAG TPA: ferredoxin family protein [Sedimentisphaerales bacterium]|nr:ferredoxin family protein [Sedimentisphaerales bacterium]
MIRAKNSPTNAKCTPHPRPTGFFFTKDFISANILWLMAGKIIINAGRCKGCGLCVSVCPRGCIIISGHSNKNGYYPAHGKNSDCTGCAMCALICPDAAIEVYRDNKIVAVEPGRDKQTNLTEERV